MSLPTQVYSVTRDDLVAYAAASGDQNPIHQDESVALSVGLPGVIAHGMYTMALAARAVSTWFPGAEVVSFGCKFTNPVVVPAEGSVEVDVAGVDPQQVDPLLLEPAEGAEHRGRRGEELALDPEAPGARLERVLQAPVTFREKAVQNVVPEHHVIADLQLVGPSEALVEMGAVDVRHEHAVVVAILDAHRGDERDVRDQSP